MHLAKLKLINFRSCAETEIEFTGDLTVLVGENGSGKSNVIDAIRLATYSALERPSLWFEGTRDRTYGKSIDSTVKVTQTYVNLTENEKAIFLAELVDNHDNLIYSVSFNSDLKSVRQTRPRISVGENDLPDSEPENHERIAHVYLPPLRDAVRELGSNDGSRLAEILRILSNGSTAEFEADANDLVKRVADLTLPQDVQKAVQLELQKLTHPTRGSEVHIGGKSQELRKLAALLRVTLSESGLEATDLSAAGLGHANLLYIAMIVLQLEKAQDYDLTVLLVEEPEAHLHPQLQSLLLAYLLDRSVESQQRTRAPLKPAGRIQVVVSTHSPNLASSVSTQNIVVLSRQPSEVDNTWTTRSRPLSSTGLDKREQRKIDRYLSVTRASLVFARQVILVEGIADSIILPALAKHVVLKDNVAAMRQIESTSIIAIDGVDFNPYLKLLLGGVFPIVERVVVVTDGDKANNSTPGLERKANYENAFPMAVSAGILKVCVGEYTLEADFFGPQENDVLLRAAWNEIHPRSGEKWEQVISDTGGIVDRRAECFSQAMKNNSLDVSKGDFAQVVAHALESSSDELFVVPSYLREAIEGVLLSTNEAMPTEVTMPVEGEENDG